MVLLNDFDDFYQRAVLLYRSDPSQVLLSFTFLSPRTDAHCRRVLFASQHNLAGAIRDEIQTL